MVSEACATGRPAYTLALPGRMGRRLSAFHEGLRRRGLTRPFADTLEHWQYPMIDETARIAALVREHLANHPGGA